MNITRLILTGTVLPALSGALVHVLVLGLGDAGQDLAWQSTLFPLLTAFIVWIAVGVHARIQSSQKGNP